MLVPRLTERRLDRRSPWRCLSGRPNRRDSEITPHEAYLNRRAFLRAGLVAASAAGTALVYRRLNAVNLDTTEMPAIAGLITAPHADGFWVNEAITPRPSILNYNNFGFVPGLMRGPVLLCGPTPMMAAMRGLLVEMGIPHADILQEAFVSSSRIQDAGTDIITAVEPPPPDARSRTSCSGGPARRSNCRGPGPCWKPPRRRAWRFRSSVDRAFAASARRT